MAPADTTDPLAIARARIAAEAEARTGRLDLDGLGLPYLPEELFELTHLRELDLGNQESWNNSKKNNRVGNSHDRLAVLTRLEWLNVGMTDLPSLDFVRSLPLLQSLIIDSIPSADLAPLSACTVLQDISCSRTSISDLAPLGACTVLRSIDCSYTLVSNLEPLATCIALESLDCSFSAVSDLAPLAACTALESVDCSFTEVSDLTPLATCTALQLLTCSFTAVRDLALLATCTALQSLDCHDTEVMDLAPLAGCTALQHLDCQHTEVTDLSPLVGCTALETIDCSLCRLNGLPETLLESPSLITLIAYRTTIPGVPDGILSAHWYDDCLPRLRGWLVDQGTGAAAVPGVKLLLLGNGRVGKTQIAQRLAGEAFEAESDSTHGIRIGDIALPALPDTRLWVWDFGGQDIYHGTHALFLQSPALLAVVWAEAMEGEATHSHGGLSFRNHPLPYWLDIISHHGHRDSPTLVVQTRCDAPGSGALRPPADEERMAAARCLHSLRVSAATPRGFEALTEALADAVAWQRERLGVPRVGVVWRTVQLRLEAMRAADQDQPAAERRRLLTIPEFEAICQEEGGVTAPEHLLHYLDATGTVLHRPGLFDDRIVLDQNWAMEAVYAVFDRDRGAYRLIRHRNRGRFTLDDLALTVWVAYGDDDRRLFLNLMRTCGVAFRHRVFGEGDERIEEFIAPELLPEPEEGGVAARWDEGVATETRVFKHPLLHGGLIRAIMAELGEEAGPDALYWQGGLCGYEAETRSRFLIEERMTGPWQGEIIVRTQCGAAAELLARLVGVVEEQQRRLSLHPEPSGQLPAAPPTEPERPMTFSQEPTLDRDWYVSYAWSDNDTPEGREREAVVDRLCAAAEAAGPPILRDKKALSQGDSISAFMRRLGAGSRVFVILSEKYLRSPACMFELSEIWRNCKHDTALFRRTVRVYTLPCATIWTARDRLGHAIHWKTQHKELDDAVKEHGTTILGDHDHHALRQMGFFFTHVGDMLGTLADTVQPRSFDELVRHGFTP